MSKHEKDPELDPNKLGKLGWRGIGRAMLQGFGSIGGGMASIGEGMSRLTPFPPPRQNRRDYTPEAQMKRAAESLERAFKPLQDAFPPILSDEQALRADTEATRKDWETTGGDLRQAMDDYGKEK